MKRKAKKQKPKALDFNDELMQKIIEIAEGVRPEFAALIAAAPEMLVALELIEREVTVLPGTGKDDGNIGWRHIHAIREAIAKARGEK